MENMNTNTDYHIFVRLGDQKLAPPSYGGDSYGPYGGDSYDSYGP